MPTARTSHTAAAQAPGLHIFKPGQHIAMSGDRLAFSEADLQATVQAYNPTLHEAPLVVGHPKTDSPAYGWVQALSFNDGSDGDQPAGMFALPAQVNPDFADLVAAGAFKKISASFYAPDAPSNPVPGVYYLRHVGFLGAQPPAVKGLRTPSFADQAEEGVVTFSEWSDMDNAALWRSLREWLIGKFGTDEADKVIPGYQVKSLEQAAQAELAAPAVSAAFNEGNPNPQPKESAVTEEEAARLRAENEAQAAQIAQLQATAASQAAAARHAENTAFAEKLVAESRLLPAAAPTIVATLDHLAALEQPVEFGEGEQRAPLLQALKTQLQAAPQSVSFGETATRDRAATGDAGEPADGHDFAESADPERLKQHQAVLAHMAAHKVDYATAAAAVIK